VEKRGIYLFFAMKFLILALCAGTLFLHFNRGDAASEEAPELIKSGAFKTTLQDEERGTYDKPSETEQVGVTGVQVIKSDRTGVRNYEKSYPVLIDAAYRGLLGKVRQELENSANPNMKSFDGGTPLMYCVRNGDDTDEVKIFDLLIDYGARATGFDVGGFTALHMTPNVQDLRRRNYFVEILLKHGARMDEMTKLSESSTKVEGQRHDLRAYNVLEIMINNYDRLGVIDQLMRWGWLFTKAVRARARDYAYDMGLRYITENMDPYETIINRSFKGNALLSMQEQEALRRALSGYGFYQGLRETEFENEYTRILVNDIPVLTYRGMTPLMMAVLKHAAFRVKALLQEAPYLVPVLSGDRFRRTALHMAVLQHNAEIAGALIKAKASVGASDWQGNTPLHLVAWIGNITAQKKLTPLLVEAGGKFNSTNSLGDTVLHRAVRFRDLGYVEYLMVTYKKDIDLQLRNNAGLTAYKLAEKLGLMDMMRVLQK
jgi:ankyrin repeat protein